MHHDLPARHGHRMPTVDVTVFAINIKATLYRMAFLFVSLAVINIRSYRTHNLLDGWIKLS